MHTLRPNRTSEDRLVGREIPNPQRILRRRFTNCSPPQKTTLPVWISPPRKKCFAAVLRPLRRFTHSSPQRTPQKRETPRHLCHGHSPKPHSSLSAMRSLPHSPRFYTHFTPKSTPFHKVFRIRQNLLIFDTFNF